MVERRRPLVFITDYGYEDIYGSALVGASLKVDSGALCILGTHGVPAGDILAGAYQLKAAALAFPLGTIVCVVVDPGVGTSRRAIAVQAAGVTCVAPDNGLISYLWMESTPHERHAVEIAVPASPSATFAGRDVFAPTAAHLARGASLQESGSPIADPIVLADAFARREGDAVSGRVVVVDHFGNAITTIRRVDLAGRRIRAAEWSGGRTSDVVRTYDEIRGPLAVLIGSAGHLEIAARRGPAVDQGGPQPHEAVVVSLEG